MRLGLALRQKNPVDPHRGDRVLPADLAAYQPREHALAVEAPRSGLKDLRDCGGFVSTSLGREITKERCQRRRGQ